jgi:hypothetical protein
MLLIKEVEVTIGCNLKYYENKGYTIPKKLNKKNKLTVSVGTTIKVKIEDLPLKSRATVEFLCDYCLIENVETKLKTPYSDYTHRREVIEKDCCKKCSSKKQRDVYLKLYGVTNNSQLPEWKKKIKNTCQEKYGVDNVFQLEGVKKKSIETCVEKYGVEHYTQSKEYIEKSKVTNLEKYGSEWFSTSDEYKRQAQEKYGETNVLKCKELIPIRTEKMLKTLYSNGTQKCSLQQRYLFELLNGDELNYLVKYSFLDIAFFDEKLYIEYSGSGHDLEVKYNNITKEEFDKRELRRYFILRKLGWNLIEVISRKDYLPSDTKILQMFDEAKEYLKTGHSWIKFDVDNNIILNTQGSFDYDYGMLRKIKKEDIDIVLSHINIQEVSQQ